MSEPDFSDDFYESEYAPKPGRRSAPAEPPAREPDDEARRLRAAVSAAGPAVIECWRCHKKIHDIDRYCRHCGKGQGVCVPWTYKPWGIILITLCIGPFSLWYVWRSPVLKRGAKIGFTVVLAGLTIYVAVACYKFYMMAISMLTGSGTLSAMQAILGS
ncbi:MAG: hypothetical protein PHW69_09870 [Elusimicrobiaceae bacterium]|nr:hypothetical protein [Elusimicrobiaceae bacterium]